MSDLPVNEAIAVARQVMGIQARVRAIASLVERLDRTGEHYYLVVFGEESASTAVACVSVQTRQVMVSGRSTGRGPHLSFDLPEAIAVANLGSEVSAKLVWRPCTASFSPLYPLWEISRAGETVFIDQGGKRWTSLPLEHG